MHRLARGARELEAQEVHRGGLLGGLALEILVGDLIERTLEPCRLALEASGLNVEDVGDSSVTGRDDVTAVGGKRGIADDVRLTVQHAYQMVLLNIPKPDAR